jgi:hypothetical protein
LKRGKKEGRKKKGKGTILPFPANHETDGLLAGIIKREGMRS